MKTATVADLRNHFPKIAAWLAAGEQVRVTRRGKPVAKIVPDRGEETAPVRPDFAARRKALFGNRVLSAAEVWAMREAEHEGTAEDLHGY
jgi:prevent-host-death family protein